MIGSVEEATSLVPVLDETKFSHDVVTEPESACDADVEIVD